jgi:hypothetical protein
VAEIRRIRAEEAPLCRELYRGAVRELAERHPDERIGISEQGLANLETQFGLGAVHEDEATFVAQEDDELVGFVTARVTRSRALPGVGGEIHELWASAGSDVERRLAEAAVNWLTERGARTIFHSEDLDHPDREPWESLGFEADVVRFSRYL